MTDLVYKNVLFANDKGLTRWYLEKLLKRKFKTFEVEKNKLDDENPKMKLTKEQIIKYTGLSLSKVNKIISNIVL